MATLEEGIRQFLIDNGMWEHCADEVVERVKTSTSDEMEGRWQDEVEGHPIQFLASLQLIAKRHALEYIDEKMPKVWFRRMFEPEEV